MFETKKPYYFVFSNEGETYYLPSMLHLSLDDYLYYHLKLNGCNRIFRIKTVLEEGKTTAAITVRTEGGYLSNSYKGKKKGIFGSAKIMEAWTINDNSAQFPKTVKFTSMEVAVQWMLAYLSEPDIAFMADSDTFKGLLENMTSDDLARIKNHVSSSADLGRLVICFPIEMPYEMFQNFIDVGAFHEIFDFECDSSVINHHYTYFDYLKNQIPDQLFDFGNIGFDELKDIIENAFFDKDILLEDGQRNDLRNFFYYHLYCRRFREEMRGGVGIFAEQYVSGTTIITRKAIYEFLVSDCKDAISERIKKQYYLYEREQNCSSANKPLYEILYARYGKRDDLVDLKNSTVKIKLDKLNRLESMKLPQPKGIENYDAQFKLVVTRKADWDEMRMNVRKPHSVAPNLDWLELIDRLCTKLSTASKNNDLSTALRIEGILMFCTKKIYDPRKSDFKYYEDLFREYIDCSTACFEKFGQLNNICRHMERGGYVEAKLSEESTKQNILVWYGALMEALLNTDAQMIAILSSEHVEVNQLKELQKKISDKIEESVPKVDAAKAEEDKRKDIEKENSEKHKTVEDYTMGKSLDELQDSLMRRANKQ